MRDVERLIADGEAALAELFTEHRQRLERLVAFRLDPRIRGRVDPADVLQEAYLLIAKRLDDYLASPTVSLFVWMRQQTLQVLIDLQRGQFRDRRSPTREVRWGKSDGSSATSFSIACLLVDAAQTPSQVVAQAEELEWVRKALDSMNPIDREVLALRHFEQLGNAHVAEILGLTPTAASNRYVRAASRLGEIVAKLNRSGREGNGTGDFAS